MSVPTEPVPTPACRVVLVDARDERRRRMRPVIEGDDPKVILVGEADGSAAALAVVDEQRADAVVIDVQMPVPEGLATIAALRERFPQLGIVACSFDLDHATVQRVLAEGADRFLAKPLRRTDVHAALSCLRADRAGDGSSGTATIAHPASAVAR